MSRKAAKFHWNKDQALALIAIIYVAILSVTGSLNTINKDLFSLFNRLTPINLTSTPIELISINKHKLESKGAWPLQRKNIAHLLKLVESGKPDIVATTLPLIKVKHSLGSEEIYHLNSIFKKRGLNNLTVILKDIKKNRMNSIASKLYLFNKNLKYFSDQLKLAKSRINQNEILSQELKKINNIDLSYTYIPKEYKNTEKSILSVPLSANLVSLNLPKLAHTNDLVMTDDLKLPLNIFSKNVTGLGAIKESVKNQTNLSKRPLAINYKGTMLPSLALLVAAQDLHIAPSSIQYITSQNALKLGSLRIHTGKYLEIYPRDYTNGINSYKDFNYSDVLNNKIKPNIFRHKIILIGTKNTVTNNSINYGGISLLANQIYSILNNDSLYSPYWSDYFKYIIWFLSSVYLILITPFIGKWLAD